MHILSSKFYKIFILLMVLIGSSFASDLKVKQQDVSPKQLESQNIEIAKYVAIELSKDLPKVVDKYTKFTSIKSDEAKLIYTFEINIAPKNEEDVIKADRLRMEKSVTDGICSSSKRFLDAQISISYKYINSLTKTRLFQFDVSQKDCYKLYGMQQ